MTNKPDNRATVAAAREGKRGQIIAAVIVGVLGIAGLAASSWLSSSYPKNQPLSRPAAIHVAPGAAMKDAKITDNEFSGAGSLLKNEGNIDGLILKNNRMK